MGRKRKYLTKEEQKEAQRKWNRTYYHRNKKKLNKETMRKYYEEKIKETKEKLRNL